VRDSSAMVEQSPIDPTFTGSNLDTTGIRITLFCNGYRT
jgi:hypothetical protein